MVRRTPSSLNQSASSRRANLSMADASPQPRTVRVEVHDGDTSGPRPRESPDGIGGLGLRIIDALAIRWGWELASDGKVVWAELAG